MHQCESNTGLEHQHPGLPDPFEANPQHQQWAMLQDKLQHLHRHNLFYHLKTRLINHQHIHQVYHL